MTTHQFYFFTYRVLKIKESKIKLIQNYYSYYYIFNNCSEIDDINTCSSDHRIQTKKLHRNLRMKNIISISIILTLDDVRVVSLVCTRYWVQLTSCYVILYSKHCHVEPYTKILWNIKNTVHIKMATKQCFISKMAIVNTYKYLLDAN